jgi:signal transduction histidine kinase/PAS domain-containing protein
MNYQSLSRIELLRVLEVNERVRSSLQIRLNAVEDSARLVADLQRHQAELEAQNAALREAHHQLEQSRCRYADLYELAPVPFCTLDRRGIVLELNLCGAALLGSERALLIGKPLLALLNMPPDTFTTFLQRCFGSRVPVAVELTAAKGRESLELRLVGSSSAGDEGTCRTAILDITAERKAQRAAAELQRSDQLQRARMEAIDSACSAVTHALLGCEGGDIRTFLQVVADEARAMVRADYAALSIRDELEAESLAPGGKVPSASAAPPARRTGPASTVTRSGHAIYFRDRHEGERSPEALAAPVSFISAPILSGSMHRGGLYVANKTDGTGFSESDEILIEMLAERVAGALELAQLRRNETRANARLELLASAGPLLAETIEVQDTLGAIAKLLVPLVADMSALDLLRADGSADRLAVYHADAAQLEVLARLVGRCPETSQPPAARRALLSAQPEHQNLEGAALDEAIAHPATRAVLRQLGVQSVLVCPLVLRGHTIGLLHLMSAGETREFADEDVTLAEAVAHHAALVIEGTRLYSVAQSAIRARDNTLAVVSHDLRNYLSTVRVGVELLAMAGGSSSQTLASFRQISAVKRAVAGMHLLIDDLRDAAVLESGAFTIHAHHDDVGRLLDDAEQMLVPQAEGRAIRLRIQCEHGLPELVFDRARILQVLANLVHNALKATPRGGEVRIDARRLTDSIELSVSDNGSGIPAHALGHVFTRHWASGAQPGSGLGLYIVKALVEAHGGAVAVASTPGAGTRFSFTLPLIPA